MRTETLIFIVPAVLMVLTTMPISAQIQLDVSPEFALNGIEAVGNSDPRFNAFIDALTDSSLRDAIGPVLPYSIALINNGRLPIAAVVMRFPRKNAAGNTIDGAQEYILAGAGKLQATGITLIFTPEAWLTHELDASILGGGPVGLPDLRLRSLASVQARFNPIRFPQTTISLDSVVLSDGTLIGPDRFGAVQREARRASAVTRLQARIDDASVSDSDLLNFLKVVAQEPETTPAIDPTTNTQDPIQLELSSIARSLLGIVEQHGRSSAGNWLTEIESSPEMSPIRSIHYPGSNPK